MAGCLSGCGSRFKGGPLLNALDADVVAPIVTVTVSGPGGEITVGNKSSPGFDNHAIVKSFQYGLSNGTGLSVEIVDEEGGAFRDFFRKIVTCMEGAKDKYVMSARWGWITEKCQGGGEPLLSKAHKFLLTYVAAQMENGVFKFVLTGVDTMQLAEETRSECVHGSDESPMPLKDAIRQLFQNNTPPVPSVKFLRITCQGTSEWEFEGDPVGKWRSEMKNPMTTALEWIRPYKTDRGKGIFPAWNDTADQPEIIFWEDYRPDCNQLDGKTCDSLGTVVVNGGKCLWPASTVETEDGWKRINWIVKHKYSGKVKCVDENGKITWSNIINWYKNPRQKRKLIKVHLSNSRQRHNSISGAIFTEDHEILTNEGYVKVKDLNILNHKINSGTYQPSKEVHNAIIGIMLGDGHIKRSNNSFECTHCSKQKDYVKHKSEILNLKLKKGKNKFKVQSKASPYWRKMRKLFYQDKKVITEEVLKDFNEISLAYLFMDDGYLKQTKNTFTSEIATCCFNIECVKKLVSRIKSMGIDCKISKSKYPRIIFNSENTKKLSKMISPYVVKSMDYKVLEKDRKTKKKKLNTDEIPFYDTFSLHRCGDKEPFCKTVFCIEVEKYNNFMTHSGIVKNCSNVISFKPEFKWAWGMVGVAGGQINEGKAEGQKQGEEQVCRFRANESKQVPPSQEGCTKGGTQTENQTSDDAMLNHGTKEATKEVIKSDHQHKRANQNYGPIKAELTVQGLPQAPFDDPVRIKGKKLSIVYINPFHIIGGSSACGDWLRVSNCNEILSNRNWRIDGVNHDMREGNYTTTFQIVLDAPGSNVAASLPLGSSSNGFNVPC